MRKILLLAVSLTGSYSLAQSDAVLDILAKESCECIKNKNIDLSKPDPESIKKEFGICVLQSYSRNSEAFGKEHPLDVGNREAMVKLGEQVGMKMLGFCPEVLMALAGDDEEEATTTEVVYQQIEGQVSEIRTDQFVTLVVRDKNGRNYNFLMLDYFETASLFTNNQIKKNDKLVVSYSEVELYDPKAKEFRYFKVITGLEKK